MEDAMANQKIRGSEKLLNAWKLRTLSEDSVREIGKALDELPEQCGKAFKLSRFHHLSYAEIAEAMDISVKTVENHMGKALAIMRKKLADYLVLILFIILISH